MGQSHLGIDDEQRQIGFVDRRFRLGAHAALKGFILGLFKAGRIDDAEAKIDQLGVAGSAVTRDTRRIVDER
ncbi:hypothetical protein RHSP_50509 [Rhizobium freirei PRF 81]|uniref:Uncharacterized protein n=1 Tax=Rhizobium freirei PRF 81 TaxID=363754 RepID=N6V4E2_9HYPH|nr:hypothetical protein RHSP_50509 [Rhizobium freirei PRF 81]